MAGEELPRRLVVVADDLGRSTGVNRAIAAAHEEGIVTSASLMAGGEAFDHAVEMARSRPRLAVGLHATLCDGRAVLPSSRVPGLAGADGRFEPGPARAGIRYWRRRELIPRIEAELSAQFDRLIDSGIAPSHADGHHHLHIHPLLFGILCREAARRGVRFIRIPRGDLLSGRAIEWGVFGFLGWLNRKTSARHGIIPVDRVHGLARTGRIDEAYLLSLLPRIGAGWNEIFVHPDLDTERGRRELAALTSPRVRKRTDDLGIVLSAYGRAGEGPAPAAGGSG